MDSDRVYTGTMQPYILDLDVDVLHQLHKSALCSLGPQLPPLRPTSNLACSAPRMQPRGERFSRDYPQHLDQRPPRAERRRMRHDRRPGIGSTRSPRRKQHEEACTARGHFHRQKDHGPRRTGRGRHLPPNASAASRRRLPWRRSGCRRPPCGLRPSLAAPLCSLCCVVLPSRCGTHSSAEKRSLWS